MTVFMQVPHMKGSVGACGHEGWIELNNAHILANRTVRTTVGQSGDRVVTLPKFPDIAITKPADTGSTNALFSAMCSAQVFDEILIDICRNTDKLETYMRYTLNDVIISRFEQLSLQDGSSVESILLNYTRIEQSLMTKTPQRTGYKLPEAELM